MAWLKIAVLAVLHGKTPIFESPSTILYLLTVHSKVAKNDLFRVIEFSRDLQLPTYVLEPCTFGCFKNTLFQVQASG